MLDFDKYDLIRLVAQAMLVGGISGQIALIMNHFFPKTIDGKPMSHYIDDL